MSENCGGGYGGCNRDGGVEKCIVVRVCILGACVVGFAVVICVLGCV